MAKLTAVIDIGSNSMRMIVLERTSRFGFHLLKEVKSKVRIAEGAYEQKGVLNQSAIGRALDAMVAFKSIAKTYKVRKILCVATSAVRDAPNKSEFLSLVRKETGIEIRVIDGEKEAYYGALAALNLLPQKDCITVDIGGGSTELGLIKNGKIEGLISLNLGTVRLKELVYDKQLSMQDAIRILEPELKKIPKHFKADTVVGIGGTNRAISNAIMRQISYPIDSIHGFEFTWNDHSSFIEKIINCKSNKLKSLGVKQERLDVIKEGALIIKSVVETVKATSFLASGAGVREGVFLSDLLRSNASRFPANFNPSVRSILDRFCNDESTADYIKLTATRLFDILKPLHLLNNDLKEIIAYSAKLCNIGESINFYGHRKNSYSLLMSNLDYKLTHMQKLLIATTAKYHGKRFSSFEDDDALMLLSGKEKTIKWLSTILTLAENINADYSKPKWEALLEGKTLTITSASSLYLAKEKITSFFKDDDFIIKFK